MKNLFIIGAGGFGRELLSWLEAIPPASRQWQVAGFLDSNAEALRSIPTGFSIVGDPVTWQPKRDELFLCGLGQPRLKRQVCEPLRKRGASFMTLVHPTAIVGARAKLGEGVILCPHSIVSVDSVVGDMTMLNYHACIAHDSRVGGYCTLSPHADITGYTVVGHEVFMGAHSAILPGVRVGDRAVIGAGAMALADVAEGATVVGPFARRFLGEPAATGVPVRDEPV